MATITEINEGFKAKVLSFASNGAFYNAIGWLLAGIIIIGAVVWGIYWWNDRKKYNAKITAHSIIHGFFYPTFVDQAKQIKIGAGGFQILELKKLKTWKFGMGARSGVNTYSFYIMPDGYWYGGQVSANLQYIDKQGGLLPVITTSQNMRAQNSGLEKQINELTQGKQGFWDKYGFIMMNIAYILIMGVFVWLSFREVSKFLGAGTALADTMNQLADSMAKLAVNLNTAQSGGTGLVPAT